MVSKEAFHHFDGRKFSYIFPDELLAERDELCDKMRHTRILAEFSFKCMGGMSKKDYRRCRYTHELLCNKISSLLNCKTESQDQRFQQGFRKLQIDKGLYPFGISANEAIEKFPEIRKYYETGWYKRGSFVDMHIAGINRI